MTLMLASVADAVEAELAVTHGADIIDLKDVTRGALTGLPIADIRACVRAIAGRRPVSAVAGDATMAADMLVAAADAVAQTGVDYVKLPLSALRLTPTHELTLLSSRVKLIGVLFADREVDERFAMWASACGFAGIMLDTADKAGGRLSDHADRRTLGAFVAACRARDLAAGLAGSLIEADISALLPLSPDFLGFRGALCGGAGRSGKIDGDAVARVRALIPRPDARRAPAAGIYARGAAGLDLIRVVG